MVLYHGSRPPRGIWGCLGVFGGINTCFRMQNHSFSSPKLSFEDPEDAQNRKKNRNFDQKFKSAFSGVESKNRVKNAFFDHFWPFLIVFQPLLGPQNHVFFTLITAPGSAKISGEAAQRRSRAAAKPHSGEAAQRRSRAAAKPRSGDAAKLIRAAPS